MRIRHWSSAPHPMTRSRTLRAHDHRYPTHPRGRASNTFLLERLDRGIREPKDLEAVYGLPLLGVVPESSALSRSATGKKDAKAALPASEAEAFHLIRAHPSAVLQCRSGAADVDGRVGCSG
jgi:hypothetical protein